MRLRQAKKIYAINQGYCKRLAFDETGLTRMVIPRGECRCRVCTAFYRCRRWIWQAKRNRKRK